MKKILILIIVVLASSLYFHDELKQIISKPVETVKRDDLVKRDNLYYKKSTDVPFTGKVKTHYKNGQLMTRGNYKNGKKDGSFVSYWSDGQLSDKGNFKNGKKISD